MSRSKGRYVGVQLNGWRCQSSNSTNSHLYKKSLRASKTPHVKLELLPINELLVHEEVESYRLKRILADIALHRLIFKPIIVESKKFIVIDGHHRLAALKSLGAKYIPAYVADYHRDISMISGWMLVSKRVTGFSKALRAIEEVESLCKRGPDELLVKIANDVLRIRVDRIDVYLAMKHINITSTLCLLKMPYNKSVCLSSDLCILPPLLRPMDIYKVVERGLKLPARTTLHITDLKALPKTSSIKALY